MTIANLFLLHTVETNYLPKRLTNLPKKSFLKAFRNNVVCGPLQKCVWYITEVLKYRVGYLLLEGERAQEGFVFGTKINFFNLI